MKIKELMINYRNNINHLDLI